MSSALVSKESVYRSITVLPLLVFQRNQLIGLSWFKSSYHSIIVLSLAFQKNQLHTKCSNMPHMTTTDDNDIAHLNQTVSI